MDTAAADGRLTPEEIARERAAVVAEALEWQLTPFHHEARVKGRQGGVDCVNLVAASFNAVGCEVRLPHYDFDWMLHADDFRFINGTLAFCDEVPAPPERRPLPGDIVIYRIGKAFAHAALVVDWPMVVHAFNREVVSRTDAERDHRLNWIGENVADQGNRRPRRFFQFKRWAG